MNARQYLFLLQTLNLSQPFCHMPPRLKQAGNRRFILPESYSSRRDNKAMIRHRKAEFQNEAGRDKNTGNFCENTAEVNRFENYLDKLKSQLNEWIQSIMLFWQSNIAPELSESSYKWMLESAFSHLFECINWNKVHWKIRWDLGFLTVVLYEASMIFRKK